MRRSLHIAFLLIAISHLAPASIAQERARPTRSEEVWTSIAFAGRPPKFFNDIIGKELRKRFRLGGEIGYRTADVFFAGRQLYFDGEIRFKATELMDIGVEHRYAYRPTNADRQRSQAKIMLARDIGRLELNYRFIFQHSYHETGLERDQFRNRFGAAFDIPKWKLDPEFRVEFFTASTPQGFNYFGTRYQLGTEWSPGKGHGLGIAVVHDRERNVAWPDHRWILSFEYSFNIRKLEIGGGKKE